MNVFVSLSIFTSSYCRAESRNLICFQETLFGKSKTPAERLRQHQRSLQKAQRELDRERSKLEQQEKKLILDIKNGARKGEIVRLHLSLLSSSWK
jgi:Skp family chaperone for outer membrane proteins